MRITKFGHSCIRLEYDGKVVVVDPGMFTDPEAVDRADRVGMHHTHPRPHTHHHLPPRPLPTHFPPPSPAPTRLFSPSTRSRPSSARTHPRSARGSPWSAPVTSST